MSKHHLEGHKNSYEVKFLNGIENNLVEYVEDFKVTVLEDAPVNEPGRDIGTVVDFDQKRK